MYRSSMVRTAVVAAAAALAATAALAQPKLVIVGGNTHDWGRVAPARLTAVVTVHNAGNADLTISSVQPGCMCTAALIDRNVLKPGEAAHIDISLDATTKSGPFEKIVTITSNDSAEPAHVLYLKADVHRAITCSPMQYMLVYEGRIGVASRASPMTLKNTGSTPITISPPRRSNGNVDVRFDMSRPRRLAPGQEVVLNAYVTPKEAQSLSGTFVMKTSSSEMPELTISISGTIAKPSTATSSGIPLQMGGPR